MLGPVIGVMITHYFVVMRGQLILMNCNTAPCDYKYYYNGFNLTAFSVTLVAVIYLLVKVYSLYGTVIACFMVVGHRRLCGLRLIKKRTTVEKTGEQKTIG